MRTQMIKSSLLVIALLVSVSASISGCSVLGPTPTPFNRSEMVNDWVSIGGSASQTAQGSVLEKDAISSLGLKVTPSVCGTIDGLTGADPYTYQEAPSSNDAGMSGNLKSPSLSNSGDDLPTQEGWNAAARLFPTEKLASSYMSAISADLPRCANYTDSFSKAKSGTVRLTPTDVRAGDFPTVSFTSQTIQFVVFRDGNVVFVMYPVDPGVNVDSDIQKFAADLARQ